MPDRDTLDAQPFRLATRPDGDRTIVAVQGELDLDTVEAVRREVEQLREQAVRSIVLDLRELAFIDSSGLRLLLQLDADASTNGFELALIAGDPVRRLLELTNLTDDFKRAEA
ncbi:MAG: STAS domain-containing protein [Conexibacter sp.]